MMELSTRTLGDWLEHWALTTPDKEYIVYSDRNLRFTWKQFNERVDHMAKGLLAIGVKRGTHVGIWAGNVPDWLTFLYACAKIGAVAVTVNTNYKQAELEYLCQNSDMHTLCIVNGDRGNDDLCKYGLRHAARTKDQPARISEEQTLPLHEERDLHRPRKIPGYVQHRRNSASGMQHRR